MQLNENQKQVIANNGNTIVIGGPGTGKSILILTKVKQLIESGIKPQSIALACFTPKSAVVFKSLMLKYIGQDAKHIQYSTFKDLAEVELKSAGALVGDFADNSQMRRLLHQAKQATTFKGSIHEAEHIIRSFKAKAKKPQENEEYYDLFSKYQDLLHNRNWYDRYDCLRQHLISIRNDIAQPSRIKHLFIDCAQDMNQIQLLWSLEHANHGVKLMLCIDDDQCTFDRSGALGAKVIDMVTDFDIPFTKVQLTKSYRLKKDVLEKAYNVVSLLDQRYIKGDFEAADGEASIEVKEYNSKNQEMESLISHIKHYFKSNPTSKVGVITRSDEDTQLVAKFFTNEKLPFTNLSRNIWEMPGSIVVIDLLEVLLGSASNPELKNVLSMFGLYSKTIDTLFKHQLQAEMWLQNGAKLNTSLIEDEQELKKVIMIQSMLTSYYNLRIEISIKDIFKALCFELMKNMSPEDKKDVLYAIERVLSFKGDIKDNIEAIRHEKKLNTNGQLVIGPVREFRNMEFNVVFMPFCTSSFYPYDYKVLGKKNSSDRRIFFMGLTRSKGSVYISYTGTPSPYLKSLTS